MFTKQKKPKSVSENTTNTLSEVVDRFLIRISVDKKKHYARYLILAEECWEDIFKNTLWVIKSVWMPTKAGNPYNYIQMPSDSERLLSVGVDDKCGLTQPLYYNNQINVIAKPTTKKCGCSCHCGELCESVNSTITTTELVFTVSNVGYYKTCWIKYCPNGDTIKWCRTPVKKYNTVLGTPGDYDPDEYNEDWLIGTPPFEDFTIVYVESQEKICTLAVAECGCPLETQENEKLFMDCCGFWVNMNCKKKYCRQFSENINSNHYGEVKVSECNTKIFFRPSSNWNQCMTKAIPDYLLVNYQSTGTSCGAETIIPKYARPLMYAMLDNGRKEYNSSFSQNEKDSANFKVIAEKNKVTGFLSLLSISEVGKIQDAAIRW